MLSKKVSKLTIILLASSAYFLFVAMDTLSKYMTQQIEVSQLMWGRYFFHLIAMLVYFIIFKPKLDLKKNFKIGRIRILLKEPRSTLSWHRDPEPRIHIPIYTNPGALFIVNHHCTHLPADGSVYFTDTRGYHTALNGGEDSRTHLVATLAYPEYQPQE